jgi:hypothetical protein
MRAGRGSPLWLIGRLGILLVFGIMPIMRVCERMKMHKADTMFDAYHKTHAAYEETIKYPVGSEGWNTNEAAFHYWHAIADKERQRIYGTNHTK